MKKLLCMLLALSMLFGLAVAAYAEETTQPPEDEAYYLIYPTNESGLKRWLWSSQHMIGHVVAETEKQDRIVVFNLVDYTTNESFPAYCTDAMTVTVAGSYYRRIELEQSTYYPQGAAQKLRSIVAKCFPFVDLEEVTALAKAAGYYVNGLTEAEAMNAAQAAIWEATHLEDYEVTDFCGDFLDLTGYADKILHTDHIYDEATAYTEANIASLYQYYMSLAGTEPVDRSMDEATLEDVQISVDQASDGMITVSAKVTVDEDIQADDELTMTFAMGTQVHQVALTADGEYSYEFAPVAQAEEVELSIDGTVTYTDVYMYEAFGGRDASQSMIGCGEATQAVACSRSFELGIAELEKDVTQIGNKSESCGVGQAHTWIIRSSVPADMVQTNCFEISDILDSRLDYLGNVAVTVGSDAVELVADVDYTVAVSETADGADKLVVSLTASGIAKAAGNVGEIRVYFDSVINANALVAEDIPNDVQVYYSNASGVEYDVDYRDGSTAPVVYTGGLRVNKVDSGNLALTLSGAAFKLARLATEDEIAAGAYEILMDGETELKVVYICFYTTADFSGEATDTAVTDGDGVALLYGLAYGEYYLVETAAPEGYEMLDAPVAVTVNEISHLDDDATTDADEGDSVTVTNDEFETIPETGDLDLFLALLTLACAAAVVLAMKRRLVK